MPSRWMTLGIVLFWAAATLWLAYREGWEKPSQAPAFTIDRTDEVGVQTASWNVTQSGRRVASVRTRLGRNADDRLYEAACDYGQIDGFTYREMPVLHLSSVYRVTPRGELRSLSCTAMLAPVFGPPVGVQIDYSFPDGMLSGVSRWSWQGQQGQACGTWDRHDAAFIPLHPLHKVSGLSEGRRWQVKLLDPLRAAVAGPLGGAGLLDEVLDAVTTADNITWGGREEPCWRIDFREPGGTVRARAWVRRRDHLVLRQEADCGGAPVLLERRLLG